MGAAILPKPHWAGADAMVATQGEVMTFLRLQPHVYVAFV
jgi:hypothetical protein